MENENFDSTEFLQVDIVDTQRASENEMTNLPRKHKFSCSTTCPFSKQEYSKSDAAQRSKTAIKLCGLIVFYTIVMVIEIIGGLKANSLAILTDAAHLLSDIAGFSISLFTVWVSGWEATPQQSFGYNRLEVIGALLSVQLIWLISGTLIYEAIQRLIIKQTQVNGKLMFAIAAFGFLVNLILVLWLDHDHHHGHGHHHHHHHEEDGNSHEMEGDQENTKLVSTPHDHHHHRHHHHEENGHSHEMEGDQENTKHVSTPHDHRHHHHHEEDGHSHEMEGDQENTKLVTNPNVGNETLNINIQGAYLHLVTDLIQSVGVMVAGSVIWLKPEWLMVDLGCTLIFSVVALSTTLPMLKNIFHVLMERSPNEIDTARLESGLKLVGGVRDVHDLHVWAITLGKHVLSCHVVVGPEVGPNEILHDIREYCEKTFRIHHVTVQIEQDF